MNLSRAKSYLIALGVCAAMAAQTSTALATTNEDAIARKWIKANLGVHMQRRPFSFIYNSKNSSELLAGWKLTSTTTTLDSNRKKHILVYTDPATGLQVRCVATEYTDYPAVEWLLYFKNTGRSDTPILENIQAIDADIYGGASGDFTLHHADGSTMLITDFQPHQSTLSMGTSVHLAPFGGRSSDTALPFFNLVKPDGSGITLGIGWTGQWAADFTRNTKSTVNIKAGMELTHLRLHPGEQIRTPAMLVMFWKGEDRLYGQNRLRQLLLAHYTPRKDGASAEPPICGSPAGLDFTAYTEALQLQGIDIVASHSLPVKYWWMDAGWYTSPKDNWALGVGNFDPDPTRYPHGLKPIADAAHAKRLGYLLWFEPERVMADTWLYNNHPEWLISPPSNLPANLMYMYNDHFHLLDLSNPAALAWLKSKVSGMITSIGIDIYRNDFNMYPVFYWRKGEPSDRQGMKEIQYVTAFYDYLDTLQREHPSLIIDNCASGGRRIDFEMLRRSFTLSRTDYLWDPIGQQAMTYGLAQWIPITGIGACTKDAYSCRSGYGSHFVIAENWPSLTDPSSWNLNVANLTDLNAVKHLYKGDFYPLGSYSTANNVWMAWQFNRPDIGEGIVQAFRRTDCQEKSSMFKLRGLDPNALYVLSDLDGETPRRIIGSELMEQGLKISSGKCPAAVVVLYKKAK